MKCVCDTVQPIADVSCPSRGTWIEMLNKLYSTMPFAKSCPSRGTWIEIFSMHSNQLVYNVVPLAGHVD